MKALPQTLLLLSALVAFPSWSLLAAEVANLEAPAPVAPLTSTTVVIHEIMFDPADLLGDDDDYEWIELFNTTGATVDLGGWSLNDVPLSGSIAPYDYLICARQDATDPDGDGAFFSAFYNADNGYSLSAPILDLNGADWSLQGPRLEVVLRDGMAQVIDSVGFAEVPGGEGDGSTLERVVAVLPGEGDNFSVSTPPERYGSPEGENSVSPLVIDATLPPGPFYPGDVVTISESILNRSDEAQVISIWRVIQLPNSLRRPFAPPGLPTHLIVPPNFEFQAESEVVVPDLIPFGCYGYQAVIGRGEQSTGSDWEEFIVHSNDEMVGASVPLR
jgi:hypothetical protein